MGGAAQGRGSAVSTPTDPTVIEAIATALSSARAEAAELTRRLHGLEELLRRLVRGYLATQQPAAPQGVQR